MDLTLDINCIQVFFYGFIINVQKAYLNIALKAFFLNTFWPTHMVFSLYPQEHHAEHLRTRS